MADEANLQVAEAEETKTAPAAPEGATQAQPKEAEAEGNQAETAGEDEKNEVGQPEIKESDEKPSDKPQSKTPKWATDRFAELTRQREEEKRQRAQAEAERDLYKAMAEGKEPPEGTQPKGAPVPSQDELQRLIQAEAARIAAQQERTRMTQGFFDAGRKEYSDFDQRCALLDNLGATEKPEFVEFVTEMPEGAKIVGHLADNPEEARRVFSLSKNAMAVELAKMGMTLSKPVSASVSRAPAPIKPIDGAAKPNDEPRDEDPDDAWFRKRDKQVRERKGARF